MLKETFKCRHVEEHVLNIFLQGLVVWVLVKSQSLAPPDESLDAFEDWVSRFVLELGFRVSDLDLVCDVSPWDFFLIN